jgi:hypothetical protein
MQSMNATNELPNNTSERNLKKLKIQEAAVVVDEAEEKKNGNDRGDGHG